MQYFANKIYAVKAIAYVVTSTVTFEISIMKLNTLVFYNIVSQFSCAIYVIRLKSGNLQQ